MATGTSHAGTPPLPSALVARQRWRRVFPGEERQLSALRRWLTSLLPECEARDNVIAVASELGSNAVKHTLSGQGGWFAVEITWYVSAVRIAVADCGGRSVPQVIDDPLAEHGRGLLLVRGLSLRTGMTGDHRGRLYGPTSPGTTGGSRARHPIPMRRRSATTGPTWHAGSPGCRHGSAAPLCNGGHYPAAVD